jgi:hypothetical protein
MEDFDYSRDISPMKGDFFSGRNLGSTSQEGRESLELMELSGLRDEIEREKELVNFRMLREKADIEMKRAKLNLDEDRRKIKNQMELDEVLPKIQPLLSQLIDDPNIDAATGTMAAEKLRLQFSPYTSRNSALNNVFDNTVNALKTKAADQTLVRQAAVEAAGGGDVKAAQDILNSGKAFDAISRLAQSKQEYATTKSKAEQQKLQQEKAAELGVAQTKSQLASLNDQLNTILGMKPQSGNLPSEGEGQFGATPSGTAAPSYTPQQKKTLEIMFKRLNPSFKNKDLSNVGFDELYSDTLEGTYSMIDELTGGIAEQSTISRKSQ